MSTPLPPKTHIASATLKVSDLKRSLAFYTETLGFQAQETSDGATLSAQSNTPAIIRLIEQPGAQPKPRHTTGLFHVAIRVPNRGALARVVYQLHQKQWPLLGASDHGVSEALYLNDPDGNGLEIYTDLPKEKWPTQENKVAMYSAPLDVNALYQEASGYQQTALQAQTDIGHVHLQVSSLERAKQFYCDLLGFDIRQDNYRGALFVAADGYHHHLGLNTWASEGAPQAPQNAVGLANYTIAIPDKETLEALASRLKENNVTFDQSDNRLTTQDQDHNTVILSLN